MYHGMVLELGHLQTLVDKAAELSGDSKAGNFIEAKNDVFQHQRSGKTRLKKFQASPIGIIAEPRELESLHLKAETCADEPDEKMLLDLYHLIRNAGLRVFSFVDLIPKIVPEIEDSSNFELRTNDGYEISKASAQDLSKYEISHPGKDFSINLEKYKYQYDQDSIKGDNDLDIEEDKFIREKFDLNSPAHDLVSVFGSECIRGVETVLETLKISLSDYEKEAGLSSDYETYTNTNGDKVNVAHLSSISKHSPFTKSYVELGELEASDNSTHQNRDTTPAPETELDERVRQHPFIVGIHRPEE